MFLKQWWRLLIIFLTPLVLLPLPILLPTIVRGTLVSDSYSVLVINRLAISMCLHRSFTDDLLGLGSDALCSHLTISVGFLPSRRNLAGRESWTELLQSTMIHFSVEMNIACSKDITTLFVGSMILAQSMEHVLLHRRLALFVLSLVGSSIRWFVLVLSIFDLSIDCV